MGFARILLFIVYMAMFNGKWFFVLFYRGSSERRDNLMKISKSSAENTKTIIRKIRQQTLKQLNNAKASKDNERLVENQVIYFLLKLFENSSHKIIGSGGLKKWFSGVTFGVSLGHGQNSFSSFENSKYIWRWHVLNSPLAFTQWLAVQRFFLIILR